VLTHNNIEEKDTTVLPYSANGADALGLFHRAKYVIWVEGPDDIVFWEQVLQQVSFANYKVKPAGGKTVLTKYIADIVEHDIDNVVCLDSDYSDYIGDKIDHPRVIYTYGYSIENSMYSPANISKTTGIIAKQTAPPVNEVEQWLEQNCNVLEEILLYDIANEVYGRGVSVLGDCCARFLFSSSGRFAAEKIATAISEVKQKFTDNEIEHVKSLVQSDNRQKYQIVRGHFLFSSIHKYVKSKAQAGGSRHSMSNDHLFDVLVTTFTEKCCEYSDFNHLKRSFQRLIATMIPI